MNIADRDILKTILDHSVSNQRAIAELSGYSLGAVNACIRSLTSAGYLDHDRKPTEAALKLYETCTPDSAVILAAGFGMRMVPINMETSKGLLEVHGEPLIERQIRQLHEAGVKDISVVVGYMKEKYEYLIDTFGVELIVNNDYASTNNIYSLYLARKHLKNTYIIPCDIYSSGNPFSPHELYSWYLMSEAPSGKSRFRVNRKRQIVQTDSRHKGKRMIGVAYLTEKDSEILKQSLSALCEKPENLDLFWEEAIIQDGNMIIPAKVANENGTVEIDTYEQLRQLDGDSDDLQSDALRTIADVFHCSVSDITDISILKKGMTNRSFLFTCCGEKYIMRIPGEGTDKLIDRYHEAQVYEAIRGKGLCDDVVYIDPANGYKITKFLYGIRTADPENTEDLMHCMSKLKTFHDMDLIVGHDFDIFGQIEFYEELWNGEPSVYRDYETTKANVFSLQSYINEHIERKTLTHIDAVPDNFLFYQNENGEEDLQLTDWEYSGMQDPHVDIAMFCIYSLYDKKQIDQLIDIYFAGQCTIENRLKIYCYVAACGLLWSNWCEYKRQLGVEFGEYSLRQYRYAKEYCRYAEEGIRKRPCTK